MSESNTAEVKLGASIGDLVAGMHQAAASVQSGVDQMKASVNGLKETMEGVKATFAGFAAILAGGAIFKEAISATTAWTGEVVSLSRVLGISTEEASTYSVALKLIGSSGEAFGDMAMKLVRQIKANEDAMNQLGLATRNTATGELKPMTELMDDAIQKLLDYKEGTDRDAASMYFFGRNTKEVFDLFYMNQSVMERAKQLAEEYGLVVGPEGAAKTREYIMAQAEVRLLFEAMAEKLGHAVMPELVKLSGWMSQVGPTAIKYTVAGIKNMIQFFEETVAIARIAYEGVSLFFELIGKSFATVAATLVALAKGGPKAAAAAWKEGNDDIKNDMQKHADAIVDIESKAAKRIEALWKDNPSPVSGTPDRTKQGTETFEQPTKGKEKGQFTDWKAAFEDWKDQQGKYFKDYLDEEIAYWQQKLGVVAQGSADWRAITTTLYNLNRQQAQQQLAQDLQDLKEQAALARANGTERIQIAGDIAARVGQSYGTESAQYKAAVREMTKAAEDRGKEMKRINDEILAAQRDHDVAMLDLDRQSLQFRQQLGDINQVEELQGVRKLEDQKYAIQRQALQQRLALLSQESEEYRKVLSEMGKLDDQHNAAVQKSDNDIVLATKQKWQSILQPVASAFDTSIKGMIQGTQNWHQAMSNIFTAVGAEFINMGVQMLVDWTAREIAKRTITTASAAQGAVVAGTEARLNAASFAASGAAAAGASVAAIPVYGWAMAPEVAAATYGDLMAYQAAIPSAAGGWDVPYDTLAMVHQDEKILPADKSKKMDQMLEGGGSSGDVHLHVHAVDSQSVERLFRDNGRHIAKAIREQYRNFNPSTRR